MHFQLSAKLCKIVNFETQNYANNCKIYQQIKSKLEFLKDVDKVDSPGLIVSLRLSVVLSALKRNHLRFEFQFPHSKSSTTLTTDQKLSRSCLYMSYPDCASSTIY